MLCCFQYRAFACDVTNHVTGVLVYSLVSIVQLLCGLWFDVSSNTRYFTSAGVSLKSWGIP